ncbi:MAG: VOC family protein [Ruminiclostridium sp.]|nr:VOC family protein [Ruminiclostridium sp.]
MSLAVYVNFNGNCREAVDFYTNVFNREKPKIMLFGDTPPNPDFPLDGKTKKLVMHAELNISGTIVMFSDVPPGMPFVAGNNISLVVTSRDMNEIKSLFGKLKAGGTVAMDLQETFWSKCYGYLTDKYGIGWQLSYDSGER